MSRHSVSNFSAILIKLINNCVAGYQFLIYVNVNPSRLLIRKENFLPAFLINKIIYIFINPNRNIVHVFMYLFI